ncbi:glycoside-pentoside-hexuronide (GPH):cation symporter [Kushneria indalinina]|uniref:GPH family glycoside/pentoside/hexuronide:cation symporter n=1 Tax=Kushneria indalinina DSM 14324 TaxID=1122140 RepID=A0A3D9DT68_9GAMM|nr:MFS transporter [Kushneria indalinina]REC93855.1 GPH family glycoside/pentoside/hexuronide:cation symporter [Kushneria indalinina DSM 14324]
MQKGRISIVEKIGFGMGDAGNNMTFAAVVMYLSYFYTDVYGISPAVVGTIFLSMRFVDAVTDPIMGAIADRTRSRWGRFRPWILFIPVPLAVACVLMFTTPDWSDQGKIIYAFVTYAVMSLLYTAVNIPYCALGGVVTSDHRERVSCQSWRFVLVGVAYLILNSSLMPLVEWFGEGDQARGFQITMGLMCVIALFMFGFCFATVRERVQPVENTSNGLIKDLKTLAANPKWRQVLAITFLQAFQFFLRQGAAIYYATWVLGLGAAGISIFVTSGVLGGMAGTAISPLLTRHSTKLRVFILSSIALVAACVALYFVSGDQVILAAIVVLVINICHGIGTPIAWAFMADAEDYGEWQSGYRNTGVSFAGNLFFLKLGLAAAGGLVGFMLSMGGYVGGADAQEPQALTMIVLLFTLIPALVSVLMTLAGWRFGLDDAEMDRIRHDLEARAGDRSSPNSDETDRTGPSGTARPATT